jgi:pimeloyl-ACP methyl ester carboxylesterase
MIQTGLCALPHGITLSCRFAGEKGRPVLMFLHGFPEAAFVWDGLLAHFALPENGGFRCIAPNLRGYEQSSAPAEVADYRPRHLMQDIAALIEYEGGPLACLVAHDWGDAVAWNLTASLPGCMEKLALINSPHPGTFLRELRQSPAQQAASAYMNFLIRPDAEALLAEGDFRRMWEFFSSMGAVDGPHAWRTDAVKAQYREVWRAGLTGPLNYYRASPLRPSRPVAPRPGGRRRGDGAREAASQCAGAGCLGPGRHRPAPGPARRARRLRAPDAAAPCRGRHPLDLA